ncbi:nucleic acid binding ob-fold trna helicase-type [Leptolyngbya sp. Heron Island J]|nr:nucleic acid binding ob-fold trna helicase-type [Leptolyngbya sp. Heron Island J]
MGVMTLGMACQAPSGSQIPTLSLSKSTVKIDSLRQPQQVEQAVPITGSVTQRLAILNGWLYEIDDGTGQVWILTAEAAPVVGEQVYVNGLLRYETILINDVDLGDYYLEEQERQLQVPETP